MKKFFILLFMQIAICSTTFAANYLTFTAEEDNSAFSIEDHDIKSNIFYSLDNGETWSQLTDEPVGLAKGDRALLKGEEPDSVPTKKNYSNFKMEGLIAASGSVMSLIDGDGESKTIPYEYCFFRLFQNCTSLTQAPELPATTLAERCYYDMFYNCTSLTQAPELPATTLADGCYFGMFESCFGLTQAPELPATTLARWCYCYMFYRCTNLKQAPELPATTLAEECYASMFESCTSLTKAPELPATTLVLSCYCNMFYKCSNLAYIKVAFTDWKGVTSTINWATDVAKNGTFICPKELIIEYDNFSKIPVTWTVNWLETRTEAVAAAESMKVQTSGLTIFVSNADTDIEVYEVGGRLIDKARNTNGDTQITVPQSGIYLVKAGAQTFKVAL